MKNDCKKLRANWLRKGSVMLTALAATVLAGFVFASISGSDPLFDSVPNSAVRLAAGLIALCGCAVFFYQLFTILGNRMVLSSDGIEIRRFVRSVQIPAAEIIRIDGTHERVMGAISQNRTIFKIITNRKTYEVSSHEFFGLQSAIRQWEQTYITNRKESTS